MGFCEPGSKNVTSAKDFKTHVVENCPLASREGTPGKHGAGFNFLVGTDQRSLGMMPNGVLFLRIQVATRQSPVQRGDALLAELSRFE